MVDYNDSYFCIAFGNKLKELRQLFNKSRHGLAEALGTTKDVIDSVELGVTGILTDEFVTRISNYLAVERVDFLQICELLAQETRLTCTIENVLDMGMSVTEKSETLHDLVMQCINMTYGEAIFEGMLSLCKSMGVDGSGFRTGYMLYAQTPMRKQVDILSRLCDKLERVSDVSKPRFGGRQNDRDEFNLDEIVEGVVVDFAVGLGDDSFVYVDEDYFGYD